MNSIKRSKRVIITILAGLALALGLVSPASAAPPGSTDIAAAERAAGGIEGRTGTQVHRLANDVTLTLTLGRAIVVPAGQIPPGMGTNGTVYQRDFSGTMQSVWSGTFWSATQSGRFFFDNAVVWETTTYRGYQGWHTCHRNSGFGYSVTTTSCPVYNAQPNSWRLQNYDYFTVTFFTQGSPLQFAHAFHANVYNTGGVYWYTDY